MASVIIPNYFAAYGRWASADVAGNKGAKVAVTGAGTFTITLEGAGLAANECAILVTPEANLYPQYAHTSNTVKTVILRDTTNVATNGNFSFAVLQFAAT
jgi:hypothetical protein